MTEMNVPELLQPVSEPAPAGENLEYDPAFAELSQAATGRPERRMGNAIIAEEPPDLHRVEELAVGLLARSKDLRIATLLARAALDVSGFEGLSQGLEVLQRLLDGFWPSVHPQIEDDDEDGLVIRHSALSGLVAPDMLEAIRNAPAWPGGPARAPSLRELAVVAGEAGKPPEGSTPARASEVEAACHSADPEALRKSMAAIERCRDQLAAIGAAFRKHARSAGPDLSATDRLLRQALLHLSAYVSTEAAQSTSGISSEQNGTPDEQTPSPPNAAPPGAPTRPQNRQQVVAMLERICEYYAAHEPSSPLPLLLRRCQRLCNLSFREIMQDMAPAALKELDAIAGKPPATDARK